MWNEIKEKNSPKNLLGAFWQADLGFRTLGEVKCAYASVANFERDLVLTGTLVFVWFSSQTEEGDLRAT